LFHFIFSHAVLLLHVTGPKARVVAHPLDTNARHLRVRIAWRFEITHEQPLELAVVHCLYIRSYIRRVKALKTSAIELDYARRFEPCIFRTSCRMKGGDDSSLGRAETTTQAQDGSAISLQIRSADRRRGGPGD
jgi:hypothetical protein